MKWKRPTGFTGVFAALLVVAGCENAPLLNREFTSQFTRDFVPLAPGEESGFILVLAVNETQFDIEFRVTVERPPAEGTLNVTQETTELQTSQDAGALGVLFEAPIQRVGLGRNLSAPETEPGLFVGGVGGFGVPAGINPLVFDEGNFKIGDTIVFLAVEDATAVGGITVSSGVISGERFPGPFTGPDTFNIVRRFLESQIPEGDDGDGE